MTRQDVGLRLVTQAGENGAAVNLLGGGLRALTVGGVDLVEPYPASELPPHCAGAVLFPWANRVRDGRWTQDGTVHHLPVDEPELGHAAHGLVRGAAFVVETRAAHAVTIRTELAPQPGFPYSLELAVTYELHRDGLDVHHRVLNTSPGPAPVALGVHPYLRVGDTPTDELTVRVDAATYFAVDDRLIPTQELPVDGTDLDLRGGKPLAGAVLNHCYGGVAATGGRSRHRVESGSRAVELWADESFGYVQVYLCPDFPRVEDGGVTRRAGRAIAIEPVTAPPDALNSGTGLRWLAPGEEWTASWGISLVLPAAEALRAPRG